jgi:poly-gamma-glutamate capsule biosynthesis protein CapA/YwtB (metallophosphatase superfamily)
MMGFIYLPKKGFIAPEIESINLPFKPVKYVSPSPSVNPLTLEKIFTSDRQAVNGDNLITLIATGDVIPARSTNFQTSQRKNFLWPFEKTADVLKSADITFINLETPLIKNCQLINEGMQFCGSSKHIEGLNFAGVDVANFGNNHSANYGKSGIDETKKLLEDNGILVTGLNGPVYNTVKGIKFAFLGYTDIEKSPLVSVADENKIKAEVAEAKKNADVVIVQYHWGTEYITPPEDRQKFLGKLTIDAGADLVIGNHPHWIKPIEFYQGKLITYGHGNFIFDQEWSQKTKEGVVGKYTFDGRDLVDVEYIPVEIINYGQPYFLEGEAKQKILNEMYQESKKLI